MCTGSYALGAVVVVAVFIVPKIEFRDNSLKNYLILKKNYLFKKLSVCKTKRIGETMRSLSFNRVAK